MPRTEPSIGISTMPRIKPSLRRDPGGMLVCRKLATMDCCLPIVGWPVAPTAITAAAVEQNEACIPACTVAAAMLRGISDFDDNEVLESALGHAFAALDQSDYDSDVSLFHPLGYGVLLQYGFL